MKPSDAVKGWFHEQGAGDALYLSAMTIAEIEKGMRSLHRRGGIERAKRLNAWLDFIVDPFGDRILTVDPVVARIAGALEDAATAKGRHPGLADVIIAATAKAYGSDSDNLQPEAFHTPRRGGRSARSFPAPRSEYAKDPAFLRGMSSASGMQGCIS